MFTDKCLSCCRQTHSTTHCVVSTVLDTNGGIRRPQESAKEFSGPQEMPLDNRRPYTDRRRVQKRPQESLAKHRRDITTNLENPVNRKIATDGDLRPTGLYCVNVVGDFDPDNLEIAPDIFRILKRPSNLEKIGPFQDVSHTQTILKLTCGLSSSRL